MQKQAPTLGRLFVIVVFTLSCFGLLLFLWLSFGGAVPLKAAGYRFNAAFPQAVQLAEQSDVRISGISVGKVVKQSLNSAHPNREVATIELNSQYAPIHTDARAILREKTLLGETYVELTPGSRNAPVLRDNGWLADGQVQPNVYLDQVLQAFDPATRAAYRNWQQDLAMGTKGRGPDLNNAIGNLPEFTSSATGLLTVLNSQSAAVRQLVRNTAVVFNAVSHNTQQLHDVIVNAGQVFQTTSDQQNALALTFKDFPGFLNQSKSTLARLQTFATNTDPLVRQLRPVFHDLKPTLASLRAFAPDLRNTFTNLDPLITASQTGLPALRDILNGASPLLAALDPFLQQLNPILQYLEVYQEQTQTFLANPPAGLAAIQGTQTPQEVGHYLRQFNPVGSEDISVFRQRPSTNRGNSYLGPVSLQGALVAKHLIFPSYDCNNTGGEHPPTTGLTAAPGCTVDPPINFQGSLQKFPHIQPDNYGG